MSDHLKESILVTGCAGFIGMHLSKALLEHGHHVFGVDNLNHYYDDWLIYPKPTITELYPNMNIKCGPWTKEKKRLAVSDSTSKSKVQKRPPTESLRFRDPW